jgi:hypothetical protein
MTNYEWRVYNIDEDDWDTPTQQELREAVSDDNCEVWLKRIKDDWVIDQAQVHAGRLPERMQDEGYKVPQRYHKMLERLAT